jgi:hypothetical protein
MSCGISRLALSALHAQHEQVRLWDRVSSAVLDSVAGQPA